MFQQAWNLLPPLCSPLRKMGIQIASTLHAVGDDLLGTGEAFGSCSEAQCRGCFPVQCYSLPESHQSRNPETREGICFPTPGSQAPVVPCPLPTAPPNLVPGTDSHRQRQQFNSYRGVAGPSRPRLGWCPLLPLPGVLAVQLVATLVTGATGWTKNNLGTNQHPGHRCWLRAQDPRDPVWKTKPAAGKVLFLSQAPPRLSLLPF